MFYRLLARVFAALHVGFVLFVVLGRLLVLRWPWLVWVHLLALCWAGATMTTDLGCVLTSLEKWAWRRGGREPYSEGFLQHHVVRFDAPERRVKQIHVALGVGVLVLNLVAYLYV